MTEGAETTATDTAAGDRNGPGALLREARTARGMSTAELAAELRLSEAQVGALEAEDHAALPPAPFVRGYLRSSARLLGIDADTLVAAYDESSEQPRDTRIVVPTHEEDRVAFPPKLALLVLLLLALGGAAAWWFWGDPPALVATQDDGMEPAAEVADRGATEAPEEPVEAPAESAEAPTESGEASLAAEAAEPVEPATIEPPIVDSPDPAVEAPIIIRPDLLTSDVDTDPDATAERDAEVEAMFEQIPVDAVATAPVESPDGDDDGVQQAGGDTADGTQTAIGETDADAAADADATVDSATDAATADAEAGPHELVLRVEGETWVEVFDDRDRQLAYALHSGDDPLVLRGWPPFRVFLGNAPAVELDLDGERVDASAFVRTNDTARFAVGEDGVTAP